MDLEGTVKARDYLSHIEGGLSVPDVGRMSPVVVVVETRAD